MNAVQFVTPAEGIVDTAPALAPDVTISDVAATDDVKPTPFVSANPEHREEVGTVTVLDVRIDPRVQRPENLRLTRKISRNLVLAALGTVTISVREGQGPDGDQTWYILLDGQQRMIGARKAGYEGPVPARFHFGLSLQEEAELFRLLNDKVDIPAADKYLVGLTEGLADVIQVQAVLDSLGIVLGPNPGQFHAVVVGRRIVAMPDGQELFRWALRMVRDFYPDDETPKFEGRLIEALARLKAKNPHLNSKSLVTKVLRQGGVVYVMSLGKMKMNSNKTTAMVGLIEALIQVYNAYLQEGKGTKLPDWDRGNKK